MDYGVLFAYIVGIMFLFILGRVFLVPLKMVFKLVFNAVIGGIVLALINFIGSAFGYHLPLNIISALIIGFLGVPGVIFLVIIKIIFNI